VNKLIQRNAGLYQVTFLDTNFEINICYLYTYYFGAVYCNNTYIEWLLMRTTPIGEMMMKHLS